MLIVIHRLLLMCCLFQAEYDAMLQEFAGEGIPLVASSVPADHFAPFLNDLLPLIMSKAVSLRVLHCTTVIPQNDHSPLLSSDNATLDRTDAE